MDRKYANCATELRQIFIINFSSAILNWMNWYFFRNLIQIYTNHSANDISKIIQNFKGRQSFQTDTTKYFEIGTDQ